MYIYCFIEYGKAFDIVSHEKLITNLKLAGIGEKDVQIIAKLFLEQAKVEQTDQENSEDI